MLCVVTDSRSSYPRILRELQRSGDVVVLELAPHRVGDLTGIPASKGEIARRLISPALLRLRGRWSAEDSVLVISWYLLPVLAMIRLGILSRPRKLVALGVFVQSPSIRRAVNVVLRLTAIPELEVIALSEGERRILIDGAGIGAEQVHKLIWGGFPESGSETMRSGPGYIFSGGYANRDYATLFEAVEGMHHPVIVAASSLNRLRDAPANVEVRTDIPDEEFERLVRGSTCW